MRKENSFILVTRAIEMKKIIGVVIVLLLVAAYLFFYLGIELELKNVVERWGVKTNQLIDSSFRIRNFAGIQLALFIAVCIGCVYLLLKRR